MPSFTRSILLIVLCLTGIYANSFAQFTAALATKRVYLNSVAGVAAPGLSTLNDELTKAGYLALPTTYLVRGAGFYTLFPKVRLATLFNFTSYSATKSEGNRTSWVRGTTAGTSLGVLMLDGDRVQLIPYAGLAYSWFGTRVSDTTPASTAFSGYLTGPSNQQHVARNQFVGNLGLHLARTGLGKSAITQQLFLGLRSGYFVPLGQPDWKTNGVPLRNGPQANTQGFYAHLLLGTAI